MGAGKARFQSSGQSGSSVPCRHPQRRPRRGPWGSAPRGRTRGRGDGLWRETGAEQQPCPSEPPATRGQRPHIGPLAGPPAWAGISAVGSATEERPQPAVSLWGARGNTPLPFSSAGQTGGNGDTRTPHPMSGHPEPSPEASRSGDWLLGWEGGPTPGGSMDLTRLGQWSSLGPGVSSDGEARPRVQLPSQRLPTCLGPGTLPARQRATRRLSLGLQPCQEDPFECRGHLWTGSRGTSLPGPAPNPSVPGQPTRSLCFPWQELGAGRYREVEAAGAGTDCSSVRRNLSYRAWVINVPAISVASDVGYKPPCGTQTFAGNSGATPGRTRGSPGAGVGVLLSALRWVTLAPSRPGSLGFRGPSSAWE